MGRTVHLSLAGDWTGEYRYPPGLGAPVPFNAALEEAEAGALSGRIDEPNTFGDPGAARLFALISGSRAGSTVSFTKTYDGTGDVHHAIRYFGASNTAFTEIAGEWIWDAHFRGAFVMTRNTVEVDAAVERSAGAGLDQG